MNHLTFIHVSGSYIHPDGRIRGLKLTYLFILCIFIMKDAQTQEAGSSGLAAVAVRFFHSTGGRATIGGRCYEMR